MTSNVIAIIDYSVDIDIHHIIYKQKIKNNVPQSLKMKYQKYDNNAVEQNSKIQISNRQRIPFCF